MAPGVLQQRRQWERAAVTGAATLITVAGVVVAIVVGVTAVSGVSAHLERRDLEAEVAAQFPTPDGWRLDVTEPMDAHHLSFVYVAEHAHDAAEVDDLLDAFVSSAEYRLTSRHSQQREWDDAWSGLVRARAVGHGHVADISVLAEALGPTTVQIVIWDEERDDDTFPESPGFSSRVIPQPDE